ncbi:hypothetical protein GGR50DRAFT_104750 [Xylaria sp. CBS 124048]|nr:hypothetical protein GGR50DRAFT_104750 [Xylaria sp. CBS 124048]
MESDSPVITPVQDEPRENPQPSSPPIEQHGAISTPRAPNLANNSGDLTDAAVEIGKYANGYHFPPKYPLKERIPRGLGAFWAFYNTGFGFFFTVYALLIVGWGTMLLLLILKAAPAMCWVDGKYNCDNIDSPRRIWIEIGSQVITALFSTTAFGLAPWRIRDLYLLLRYRICKRQKALRRLAGVHRNWLRLEGSDLLPPTLGPENIEDTTLPYNVNSVPYPLETIPNPPPTGIRAPPSRLWKMDFIAWFNVWYIILQGFLSAFMWGLTRYNRPLWTTGLFFGLTFITSSAAGIMEFNQVMNVKAIEGVPLTKGDMERLARDKEQGIPHYNNLQDKDPEKKAGKRAERKSRRG